MKKQFVTTIKEGRDHPYLGVHENEVRVYDFAGIDLSAELISISPRTKNLNLLPKFKSIRYIGISKLTPELVELMAQLPKLEVLSISWNRQTEWPSLRTLSTLKYLILYNIKKITSLEFLRNMGQLESLFVSEVLKLIDISALETTPNIREFALEGNLHGQSSVLPDIDALFSLKKLEFLKYYGRKSVFNAADFSNFKSLKYLRLSPGRYPFEFYAELEKHLPKSCERIPARMFSVYHERNSCKKCGSTDVIQALGLRQREFCPSCNKKKLDKLLGVYETLSGKDAATAIDHIPFLQS